jgi:hypothetical protein
MARARNVKEMNEVDAAPKQFMPSQRYPVSCPGCGTNSRITVATAGAFKGNKLDCDNCSMTFTWS